MSTQSFSPLRELLAHAVEERFMDQRHLLMWQAYAAGRFPARGSPGGARVSVALDGAGRELAAVQRQVQP